MSEPISEAARAYMSALGSRRTKAKAEAARQNIALANEARRRDPMSLPCICNGGDSLEASAHVWTCPRGRLLKQREKAAQQRALAAAPVKTSKTAALLSIGIYNTRAEIGLDPSPEDDVANLYAEREDAQL